jgi:hypothetical protein
MAADGMTPMIYLEKQSKESRPEEKEDAPIPAMDMNEERLG